MALPVDVTCDWPIVVCLLGDLRILKMGREIPVRSPKTGILLCCLAMEYRRWVSREALVTLLWPDVDPSRALKSLNNLVYTINKALGNGSDSPAPVLHMEGRYRLNDEAGVGVDVACFDEYVKMGQQQIRANNGVAAVAVYSQAVALYRGDLYPCAHFDVHAVLERERLRAQYLSALTFLFEHFYNQSEPLTSLEHARRVLDFDPCREDAHRCIMRCYVRLGQRAQALRQYRVCEEILNTVWQAAPEPETTALFDQIRLDPGSIL